MVVDKLFEFIEDIERFCVNHRWSRFFNDWETGDESLDEYAMIYKNCCNDIDEEKDAANDIFIELTDYMDCLYNYIDVDCVKLLDDEKQNARKWLDKVEKVIGSCVFSLKGNDLKGFLIKGYQMCHLIKEAATKTPDEYYGGRRTDVMPYYIGENKEQLFDNILNESSLKEYFFYAPPHNEEDEADIIGYVAAVRDYQTQKTKYVDDDGNVCNSKTQAKVFDTKGKADNYSYEHCPEGWTHFVVALKKSDILNEAEITKYMACCYDPEDYYEETNYIDEDGELSCSSSGAKLFNTEDEAIEYAEDNRPYGWASFAMPFNTTLSESKASLFDCLLEAIEDFPKSTHQMYRFARRRHNDTGAIRKVSKEPYWVHPEGVAKIVMEHGGSDIEIKAAMAHDVLEDTGDTFEDIAEKFGDEVASIVKEVTNDKDEIAKIGKERYISEELCRLSPEALTVKLADMLYNMKDSPTEKNYERMRKNVAFLMMNRHLDDKHLELAKEIMEV